MKHAKVFLALCLILCLSLIFASYSFACEECVQTDDGYHGCQGGHDVGHKGCSPVADGAGCLVSGNCGLKSTQ